jgi:DNA-binding HxlR family transcriptional regulator
MALLDLLGRRWALRVLWELRDGTVPTFRELQARCGDVSSSVLSERLRELRAADIVAQGERSGYRLTGEGRKLLRALSPLDAWAREWADAPRSPSLLGRLRRRDREDDVASG